MAQKNPDIYYGDISHIIEEDWGAKFFRILNSTNCFVASYLIIVLCFQFTTGLAGAISGYDVLIFHHEVRMPMEFRLWSKWRVLFVYASGTFVSLVIGLIASTIYHRIDSKNHIWSLFFYWLYINAMIMVLAQLSICAIGTDNVYSPFYINLAVVASWFLIPGEFAAFLFIPVAILLIIIGINLIPRFLSFSFSQRLVINQKGRRQYFIQIAFIPFILGCAIISPIFFPKSLIIHAVNFGCLFLVFVTAIVQLDSVERPEVSKNTSIQNLSWVVLLILISLIVFFLTIMTRGVAL